MRKCALSLCLALFCICINSVSFASSTENENLNARIRLLQERLKEFQNRQYKDAEEKMIVEEEAIDLILDQDESLLPIPEMPVTDEMAEKIVEDLENRSDVAMTVLFHDSEFDQNYPASKSFFAMIDPPKVIIEGYVEPNLDIRSASRIEENIVENNDNEENHASSVIENKQQFYESLRQKVLQATRSNKLDEEERQQLLASLDY